MWQAGREATGVASAGSEAERRIAVTRAPVTQECFMGRQTICLGLALTAVMAMTAAAPREKSLDIYFIDVMGGAATLVVTPERESVLIDSGWPGLEDRDPRRI